ncbi:MAG: hypothetical protein EBW87_04835, partial [Burkholderiaceae bacterium]|nr:hypothetical protein [Burkholderiaceae bacterium]
MSSKEMKLDFNKPITTRDGRKVRILCTDGPNPKFPVVGCIEGVRTVYEWRENGIFDEWDKDLKRECDLINPPIKRKVEFWVNIFDDDFLVWPNKEQAD